MRKNSAAAIFILFTFALSLLGASAHADATRPCGTSPKDWCEAPVGDPCGKHKSVQDCAADAECIGQHYAGESLIACKYDSRGLSGNCPTVGCVSPCEKLAAAVCTASTPRCAWSAAHEKCETRR